MNTIPTVTKNLLIINVLMFLGTLVAQSYGIDLNKYLGLHFFLAGDFNAAQLITYMFMHGGFTICSSICLQYGCSAVYSNRYGDRSVSCSITSHAVSAQELFKSSYSTFITKRYFPHTTVSTPDIPSFPWKNISI